jgi:1-acyl-sn-glycerol-3-phosphate acyltransferase
LRVARRTGQPPLTRRTSIISRLIRWASILYFRAAGWRIEGDPPRIRKFVLAGAPHTSNWDFVVFLGATDALGIRPSFMGKHTLFRWPLKRLMDDMGGIPIDRSKRANYVEQVVQAFDERDELALVIAAEGSRDTDGRWKSGFYHIAIGAGVPIVPVWLGLPQRRIRVGEPFMPTGDYRADLHRIAEFLRDADPDNPRFTNIELGASAKPSLSKPGPDTLGGRP